jgi:hypothetical protein
MTIENCILPQHCAECDKCIIAEFSPAVLWRMDLLPLFYRVRVVWLVYFSRQSQCYKQI